MSFSTAASSKDAGKMQNAATVTWASIQERWMLCWFHTPTLTTPEHYPRSQSMAFQERCSGQGPQEI